MELNTPLKGLSTKARQEALYVLRLSHTPQFRELIHKLDTGASVWSTATWFMEQKNRGDLTACKFNSAIRYIQCLKSRMRAAVSKMSREQVEELRRMAFNARIHTFAEAAIVNPAAPPAPPLTYIERMLTAEIQRLDAITMMKYCFAIQQDRVERLRTLENTAGIQFPFGNKHVQILKEITSEFWRVQAGQAVLHSRNSWPMKDMGEAEQAPIDLLPEVREVTALDPVDQNLIREALTRTLDFLHQEAGFGQLASDVEADAGGTAAPQGEGS